MIGGERGRGGQQTETRTSLNGDRGFAFLEGSACGVTVMTMVLGCGGVAGAV